MDRGTTIRTTARVLTTAGVVIAVWNFVFEKVLEEVGSVNTAAAVATIIALAVIAVDAVPTYFNNDYTEEAVIGTATTRRLKENPDAPVLVDIQEEPEENDDADEIIDDDADEIIDENAQE